MANSTLTHTAPQAKDFSVIERRSLLAHGIRIVGATAIPAFDGDVYFSGRAYMLDIGGCSCLRSYAEVRAMAGT